MESQPQDTTVPESGHLHVCSDYPQTSVRPHLGNSPRFSLCCACLLSCHSETRIFPSLVLYYKSACSYHSCRRLQKIDVALLLFRKVLTVRAGSVASRMKTMTGGIGVVVSQSKEQFTQKLKIIYSLLCCSLQYVQTALDKTYCKIKLKEINTYKPYMYVQYLCICNHVKCFKL